MNIRYYGSPPFRVAVIHGGPGVPGYMAPVARELAKDLGVAEPIQSADTLEGQIRELVEQLRLLSEGPISLVGSSWGAVLALFVASRCGKLAEKLILVGSAVFDAASSARITPLQLSRLSDENKRRVDELNRQMISASPDEANSLMSQKGEILFDAEVFHPITRDLEVIEVQRGINHKVWGEFVQLRDTPGRLPEEFSHIKSPVVLIHGEYDPRQIEGVKPFLESCLPSLKSHILPRCGHYPWIERYARDEFYRILKDELQLLKPL